MRIVAPTFAQAVYPDTWKIGRVRLRTLTLGHAVLLQRLDNPYAEYQAKPVEKLEKLTTAAFLCSRPADVAARTVDGWWARNWMVWRAITWGRTHAEREQEMRLYIAASWLIPEIKILGKSGSAMGTDALHTLWLHRRVVLGETEEQAARCPLLRARLDRLAWLEEQGSIQIRDESDTDQLLAAAMQNAEWDRSVRGGGVHG